MDFIDQLKGLAKRIETLKSQINTEEATKTSLIMPFFQILGYDVFNPLEFVPEYIADIGIKKGEKVDYAILNDGQPTIIVEAKWCGEPLNRHGNQLFRYFAATKAKFGILTNGIEYRFYTDLDEVNKMDLKPFFVVDLTNLKEADVTELKKFHKSNFDIQTVFNAAENLKYTNLIKGLLAKQLEQPDDNFVNYILSEVYDGKRRQSVIDKFTPIVKKSFNQFINDLLSDRITTALAQTSADDEQPAEDNIVDNTPAAILTPENEQAINIIRNILSPIVEPERIQAREFKYYTVVQLDGRKFKWICRLMLQDNKIAFFDADKYLAYYSIQSVDELNNFKDKLVAGLQRVI